MIPVFYTNAYYFDLLEDLIIFADTSTLSLVDVFFFPYVTVSIDHLLANLALPLTQPTETSTPLYTTNFAHSVLTYHYSIPITKLAYPEPFIASASLMHSDLWFVHILIYQYWLWFVFVYLIIFFFVTFISTVRWCNMRIQPRRETRGVSRSKCGDLITACVPVSWATSIIVHESTDAIDYYDGFGTSEMVVGIRAYQWGWEYYYPRDLDLNYTQKPSYSAFIGNSLRYENTTSLKGERAHHWKHLLSHLNQRVSNSAALLWLNTDRFNLTPILTGQTPLWTPLRNTSAFNQTRRFSKFTPYPIFHSNTTFGGGEITAPFHRFNILPHEHNSTTLSVPPFTLLTAVNTAQSSIIPIQTLDTSALLDKKTHFKGLALHNTELLGLTNETSTSQMWLSVNLHRQPSDFIPLTESSTLLATERYGRMILNFSSQNILWNQAFSVTSPSPQTMPNYTNIPSILNQTRFFNLNTSPIISTRPSTLVINADEKRPTNNSGIPTILTNKEELLPEWAIVDHAANMQVNTTATWHLQFLNSRNVLKQISTLPPFVPYNEYDFLNWQAYDILETAFWDSSAVNSFFEEAVISLDLYYDHYLKFNHTRPFTSLARSLCSKKIPLSKTGFRGNIEMPICAPFVFTTSNPNFVPSTTFASLSIVMDTLNSDFGYDSIKNFKSAFSDSEILLNTRPSYISLTQSTLESAHVFSDTFSNLALWSAASKNFVETFNLYPPQLNILLINSKNETLNTDWRLDQIPSFRLPIKNVNITAQAMQKVYKTRFDELRSFTRPNDFSLVENQIPLLSAPMPILQGSLTKNSAQFNAIVLHRAELSSLIDAHFFNFNNVPAFELPIMLGLKSDPGRHIWIDWFARWGFYEVQPSSTARYAIYGMPYFAKLFDFSTAVNEEISDTENYFIRIARARRHYQPNWVTSPFAYNINQLRFNSNIQNINEVICTLTDDLLPLLIAYRNLFISPISTSTHANFVPSTSSYVTSSRSFWQPHSHKDLYTLYSTSLLDTLTRREYLARMLLLKRTNHFSFPNSLISSPNNPTFLLWEQNFKLPLHLSSQESKIVSYIPTVLNKWLVGNRSSLDLHWGNMKNQYKPLRKGVNNLLRLHATNAIALPCEIRLQILASSKDVIHSWAVPSAGIKIDCVPGYSSHKIMIFLLSGIFWGQCMEVCGRYHHWMPIVVYFMKRDMFVLWCTHFVFYDKTTQTLRNVANSTIVQPRIVSYPISSWRSR